MNRSNEDQTFGQTMRWALDHDAFGDALGRRLLRLWGAGIEDPVVSALVEDQLRPLLKRQAMGTLWPFKAGRCDAGPILLGKDVHGSPVRLLPTSLSSGLLLVANTGGGKSNLLCFLVLQLAMVCSIWLSESYKTQLRQLRPLLRLLGLDIIILGCRDWRWNLLQAHIRDARLQLTLSVDLLVRVLELPPRSRSILTQGIHELYRRFGIWTGNRDAWPTLFDLYEWVRATPGLNPQARDAILDRLGALLLGLTPRCAAYRLGWCPSELARRHMLFEMRGAAENVKQILLGSLLFSVFHREVEGGVINGPLKLVIAFDDSQRLFDAGAQGGSGELTPMDEMAGVIRGTGLSLWILPQSSVGLSRRLVSNLGTKVIGRLGTHEDYASLGADMGLSAEQIDWARLHLRPGQFIGQLSQGWREPFAFEVPLLEFAESVSDVEASQTTRVLDSLPTVFADEFADWQPHYVVDVPQPPPPASEPNTPTLDEAAIRYLKAVLQNPGRRSSDYSRLAGLGARQAIEVRDRLVESGYLRKHRVTTGVRGRQAVILEPLPSAYDAVNSAGGRP